MLQYVQPVSRPHAAWQHCASVLLWRRPSRRFVHDVVCQSRPLIKRKDKLPARLRKKKKYQDDPRRLVAIPGTPNFEGRLLTEINSVNGPMQLSKIIRDYGPDLSGPHVSAALARLGGFSAAAAGGGGLRLPADKVVAACAKRCLQLMKQRVAECDPLTLARSAFALGRLKAYDKVLFDEIAQRSFNKLHQFQPDTLAGLITGFATFSHKLPMAWLDRFCLESYARFSKFDAQALANSLYSLMKLQHTPSAMWLDSAQRLFRETYATSCNAPTLVKFIFALVKFQAKPSFNWMVAFMGEARRRIDTMTSKELATVLWACSQLGHTPDPVYMEAWYRCAARRMGSFAAPSLLLAVQALTVHSRGQPAPGKFMQAVLPRLQALMPQFSAGELAQLLWSLVNLRLKPSEEWMDQFAAESERRMADMEAAALPDLMWALARLRYQPSPEWMALLYRQVDRQIPSLTAQQLGLVIWGTARVECLVPDHWMDQFEAKAHGLYTPVQLQDIAQLLTGMAASNTEVGRAEQAAAAGALQQVQQMQAQQAHQPRYWQAVPVQGAQPAVAQNEPATASSTLAGVPMHSNQSWQQQQQQQQLQGPKQQQWEQQQQRPQSSGGDRPKKRHQQQQQRPQSSGGDRPKKRHQQQQLWKVKKPQQRRLKALKYAQRSHDAD